jgi:hypothetical protein
MREKKSGNFYNENTEKSLEMKETSLDYEKNQNLIKKIENEIEIESENENSSNTFSKFLNFVTFGFIDDSSPINSNKYIDDNNRNDNDNNNDLHNNHKFDNTNKTQNSKNEESFIIKNSQNNSDKINSSPFKGKWNVDASTQTDFSELNHRQQKSTSLRCEICIIM